MTSKIRLGILVSGSGTNLQAIINNCSNQKINAKIEIVISDNEAALAIQKAKKAEIPTAIILRNDFKSKKEFETKIITILKDCNVDLICLAGFMRILSRKFIETFSNKMINIHPALLPAFPGLHAQKQAFDCGVKITGCTVHFVDEGTDTGPIILQKAVSVMEDDSLETLTARILKEEHQIYSKAIQLYSKGQLEIKGKRVVIRETTDRRLKTRD